MSVPEKFEPVARYRNEINRAALRLDLTETRIILSAIAKAGAMGVNADTFYDVTAEDLMAVGATQKVVYSQLADAAKTLFERHITLYDDVEVTTFRWVSAVRYRQGEGRIGVMFCSYLIPYLRDITSEFTRLPLHEIRDLRSSYTVRLYCLFLQFKATGHFCVTVEDLRRRLMLEDKFALYADLKKRIILPSLKEINLSDSTSIRVSLVERKDGRRVHSLDFEITPNDPPLAGTATVLEEIPKLSPKQVAMFADRLSGLNPSVSFNIDQFSDQCTALGYSLFGKSKAECAQLLRKALLDDRFVEGVMPFLLIVGYHPPKQSKQSFVKRKTAQQKVSISDAVEVRSVQLHAAPTDAEKSKEESTKAKWTAKLILALLCDVAYVTYLSCDLVSVWL